LDKNTWFGVRQEANEIKARLTQEHNWHQKSKESLSKVEYNLVLTDLIEVLKELLTIDRYLFLYLFKFTPTMTDVFFIFEACWMTGSCRFLEITSIADWNPKWVLHETNPVT